jgi:hypothetical protein
MLGHRVRRDQEGWRIASALCGAIVAWARPPVLFDARPAFADLSAFVGAGGQP